MTPIIHDLSRILKSWKKVRYRTIQRSFVGSQACQGCHASIYEQWSKNSSCDGMGSNRAKAFVGYGMFSCHSTGGGLEDGPGHPTQITKALQGLVVKVVTVLVKIIYNNHQLLLYNEQSRMRIV